MSQTTAIWYRKVLMVTVSGKNGNYDLVLQIAYEETNASIILSLKSVSN